MMHGDFVSAGIILLIGGFLLALTFGFMDQPADDGLGSDIDMEYEDWLKVNVAMIQSMTGPIEIESGMIHAVGVGEGSITKINGETVNVTVSPAHADLILMNGQSNAAYYKQYGQSTFSDADRAVTPAPRLGTSFYYGYEDSMPFLVNDTLSGCAIRDFVNPDGTPKVCDKGPEFCRTWTETTGKKALWVSLGIPGRAIEYWLPDDGLCWTKDLQIMTDFNGQLEDTGFIVDRTIVLWAQGESDWAHGTTEEEYVERFTTLHAAASEAWGHEIDRWYLISGLTAKIGWVNDIYYDLAATIPGVRVATSAALVDSFTLDNGLMANDGLKIHYTQQGDNAVANAAARYALDDLGHTISTPAPTYLIQATTTATVGSTLVRPATAECYRTDESTTDVAVKWDTTPSTATAGVKKTGGRTTGNPGVLLPFYIGPLLIVTVTNEPAPPEPDTFTVSFAVATDSTGYGSVSIASLADVVDGTTATIGQTIVVGSAGQCTATPAADTAQYSYAFAGWTGADDSSTQAPTTITTDTTYYAHFTRSEITPTPMNPSLFTFTVANGSATVTGWAGTPPADGYDLYLPDTDGQGHPLTGIYGSSNIETSTFAGAKTLKSDTVTNVGQRAFRNASLLESVNLPAATSVGTSAFYRCTSLVSVNLPAVTSIGQSTFSGCTSLASVSLPAVTSIDNYAFDNCTSIENVTFGPLTSLGSNAIRYWTFYQADGTTVLSKTAANLKNSTFVGTASALIKVAPGAKSLTTEMEKRVAELTKEHAAKLDMLTKLDPALADMDSDAIAKMTTKEIGGLTKADVEKLKADIESKKLAEDEK